MIWSILVATHSSRGELFARLQRMLKPQLVDGVEVVVLWNRGARSIGEYRQALIAEARGEYVAHVDDDDRLPDYYVSEILTALEHRPDYVGFLLECHDLSEKPLTGKYRKYVASHSIKHDRWHQQGNRFFRDVTHLNPIRRDIALLAPFVGWRAEDHQWAQAVRPHVKTEVFIDRTMYFYDFAQEKSIHRKHPTSDPTGSRPVLELPFRLHPQSEV